MDKLTPNAQKLENKIELLNIELTLSENDL